MSQSLPPRPAPALEMDSLPVTALHVALAVCCGLGLGLDMMEMALGSVLSVVFSARPQVLPASELSFLLSAVYVGAIFGAPALGVLADRYGRRAILSMLLLWVGVVSFAIFRSHGSHELIVLRGLSGVALGAYPPVMMAYLTDQLPSRRRGQLVFCVSALATLGPPLGLFLIRKWTPIGPGGIEAWRWGFGVGGAGALLMSVAFLFLPESPRWLLHKQRGAAALAVYGRFARSRVILAAATPPDAETTSTPVDAQAGPSGLRRRLLTSALSFIAPWTSIGFPLVVGAVLAKKGFKLPDALLFIGVGLLGPTLSSLAAAQFIDRFERRGTLALLSGAALAAVLVFLMSDRPSLLIGSYFAFGMFTALHLPAATLYVAEVFPAGIRAEASASAWAMNRVGAALAPLVLIPLVRSEGSAHAFGLLALLWLCSLLLLVVAPRGQQRRKLV